jgi:nucleotide-binding universal stress UspA family protein
MFRHLLVPTDGSDLSRRTATHAITFARETGARITFFAALPQHPVSFHEGYGLTDAGTRERLIATAEQQGRAILDPLVAEAGGGRYGRGRRHALRRCTTASSPPPPTTAAT